MKCVCVLVPFYRQRRWEISQACLMTPKCTFFLRKLLDGGMLAGYCLGEGRLFCVEVGVNVTERLWPGTHVHVASKCAECNRVATSSRVQSLHLGRVPGLAEHTLGTTLSCGFCRWRWAAVRLSEKSTWGAQPNAGSAGHGTDFYGDPDRSPAPFLPPWLVATGIKSDYSCHGGFTQVRGFHSNHTERRPGNRQTEVACTVWTPAEGET